MHHHYNKIFVVVLFSFFFLVGCQRVVAPIVNVASDVGNQVKGQQDLQTQKTTATIKCQEYCQSQVSSDGIDLTVGPCLSQAIIPDWACDMVHAPRLPIDDEPKNQCTSFRTGQTHHFVEVDGNCNLIRAY